MSSSESTAWQTPDSNMCDEQHEKDINKCRVFEGRLSMSVTVDLPHSMSVEVDAGFWFRRP
jgi:hypothetical protein